MSLPRRLLPGKVYHQSASRTRFGRANHNHGVTRIAELEEKSMSFCVSSQCTRRRRSRR
jgi:hypothetical protein